MTNHVASTQTRERDSVDVAQHLLKPAEARLSALHIDLGDIARDHRLRTEADPGEEHLHLLR